MCGAVRYEISKEPVGVYACHCTDCQRITGSAFSLGVVVPDDAFRVFGREPRRAPDVIAASGRLKSRQICPDCGVWLFGDPRPSTEGAGLVRVVRGGTLDGTSWLQPTMHFWTRSAQKWLALTGIIHETQPEDLAARVHGGAGSPKASGATMYDRH